MENRQNNIKVFHIIIMSHENIYEFIRQQFGSYSYERMNNYLDEFNSYTDFLNHNLTCINKLKMADEETFIECPARAIYFNKNNKLVIMHPR